MLDTLIRAYDTQTPLHHLMHDTVIESLLMHHDPQLRSWLAKALVFDSGYPAAAQWLCLLARDGNADVRVEAVDSLSEFPCPRTHEVLRAALTDPDLHVRAYAAFGLAWTKADHAAALLSAALDRETENAVRVSILEGLYLLGRRDCLAALMTLFTEDDYHIQCSILHALEEIRNPENDAVIRDFLAALRPEDYPRAVASILEEMR